MKGDLQDFLGINIEKKEDGTIHLTQPHLIDQIIKDLRLEEDHKSDKYKRKRLRDIQAASSRLFTKHSNSPKFDNHFNYQFVLGKYNYLKKEQGVTLHILCINVHNFQQTQESNKGRH